MSGRQPGLCPIHPFARTAHSAGLRPGITVAPRGNGSNPLCVSSAVDLAAERKHNTSVCVLQHTCQILSALSTFF